MTNITGNTVMVMLLILISSALFSRWNRILSRNMLGTVSTQDASAEADAKGARWQRVIGLVGSYCGFCCFAVRDSLIHRAHSDSVSLVVIAALGLVGILTYVCLVAKPWTA